MNNRSADKRSHEKFNFDGGSVDKSRDDTSTEIPSKETKKKKRLCGKKNKSEDKFVSEKILHKLSIYHISD